MIGMDFISFLILLGAVGVLIVAVDLGMMARGTRA